MNKSCLLHTIHKCTLFIITIQFALVSCIPPANILEDESPPITIHITAISNAPSSLVTVKEITIPPPYSVVTITPSNSGGQTLNDAEPVIFIGNSGSADQKCGHGDIVSKDGHILRATPRLLNAESNFLEKLPEGSRVDIVDCRLWTDDDDISWLAVRTENNKLGWMFLQSDKFNVTVYPLVGSIPDALTGLPTGTKVAYVPPSACKSGPVSDKAVATSIGIDFIPVVGDLKGLNEVATGCDMVTGERLGNWRWLGLLGLVGLSEIAMLRHADEASDAVRLADNARIADHLAGSLSYSDEATMRILRNVDSATDFRNAVRQSNNISEAGADSLRYGSKVGDLSDEGIQALAKLDQPCSFRADTPVLTQKGLTPIALIEPGDIVLAYNEIHDERNYFPVIEVFHHEDPEIMKLTIGHEIIETTPEHPFYVEGSWISAGDLKVGDKVTAADGNIEEISEIVITNIPSMMYNLSIAKGHTYYVGQGTWLVHNACGRILRANLGEPDWARNNQVEWQAHHIIPGEFQDHRFFERISTNKWNIDGADNGIALPRLDEDAYQLGLPSHRGYHASYSSQVRSELDALENAAVREGWSEARCTQELIALIDRLRKSIISSTGHLP